MSSYQFTIFYGDSYLEYETSSEDTLLELYYDIARILRIEVVDDILCLMHEGVPLGTTVDELRSQLRALGRFSTGHANLFLIRRIRGHIGYTNAELRVRAVIRNLAQNQRSDTVAQAFMSALGSQLVRAMEREETALIEEDVAVTLNEEQLSRVLITGTDRDSPDQCSICSEAVDPSTLAIINQCNHGYHRECITEWLTQHSVRCPLCNRDTRNSAT